MDTFDIIIIGSGPAGIAAAMKALGYKKDVCIVEAAEIGGAGIMGGALVSKTMWELSSDYAVAGRVDRGYRASALSVDYDKVKQTVLSAAKEKQYQILSQIETFSRKRKSNGTLTLIRGYAKFLNNETVEVQQENGSKTIEAKHILIATGSRPRKLPELAVDGERVVDSDTVLDLKKFPKRMVIIGSGIIGCEFATIFSNFGQTEVHLLDRTNRVIPFEDNDLSDLISENLEKNGVKIHYEANLREIRKTKHALEVILDYESGHSKVIEVDVALVAIGRVPNTTNLGLENIGITSDNPGFLKTDDFCKNNDFSCKNVFAVGDITGHGQLYNIAERQGRYIIDSIYGNNTEALTYTNMSTLMFFKPEVASVGLNEKQLRAKNIPHRVAYYSNKLVSRAIAMRNTSGFVKIIVGNDDEILGMRAVSPQASAFIVSVAHLIGEKGGLREVYKTIHPHPGVTEGIEECLRIFENDSIYKPEAFPEYVRYHEWKPE
ncbi:MAG: NAD(P)/FAD-dependent oxidoreductase [Bacteroidota bacterium]|nr:NAD(P)/FAD-dependent oxidoreductase [Bacteroidota bacterium]